MPMTTKRKAKAAKQKKNSATEYVFCLFFIVGLLFLGICGIHDGTVTVRPNRHLPATLLQGEEAMTVAVGAISCASLLVLWLCRHRTWLPLAVGAAIIGNVLVATLAFSTVS